ncbi:MAG: ribosomal RNA small subunit methyltransferase A [Candidatus Thermoplasmatota archaeon]|nr:ribosomal RNA small subunit methyltransferase A [Candidatus Thermoplasmatota archaeon]
MDAPLKVDDHLGTLVGRPKKRFGQNFLKDGAICQRIARNISASKGSLIVEIGPGLGDLTSEILKRGYRVKALEIDGDLLGYLKEKFRDKTTDVLELVQADAVKMIATGGLEGEPYLVSNLPYNISSSLMGELLDSTDLLHSKKCFSEAIFMFQKEFGERLVSRPGGKTYGKISVMFNIKMEHEVLFTVPKEKFHPQPKVDGIVIRFRPREEPKCIPLNDAVLRKLLTVIFMNRRKMIRNSLHPSSLDLERDEDTVLEIIDQMGLSERRPETVEPCDLVELSNRLIRAAR